MSDFVQYLVGILISDSETNEEKQIAIEKLLSDLDLKKNSNDDNDDLALRKHKSHILAKYSQVSDEEFDYGNDIEIENNDYSENNLFRNTNARDIEDREKKIRELQHEIKIK